jgi:RND family efflux transporter MFP subunit
VPGKIVERYVDAGERVEAGQALMRIDDADLRLALAARQSAVEAAWAVLVQAQAEEERYAALSQGGIAATEERYEQAKAALDTAAAQLAAAEAAARIAENEAGYAILTADADGTVVETLAEPGQVIVAGQIVVRLAHSGPREAIVDLPETVRPALGSLAEATLYRTGEQRYTAALRQLADTADPQTRTYEARYVLAGDAADAPLGATVTIRIPDKADESVVAVPLGALLDDGETTGVWVVDPTLSSVAFRPVAIAELGEESASVTGIRVGELVVALGAHLLSEGQSVRTTLETTVAEQ